MTQDNQPTIVLRANEGEGESTFFAREFMTWKATAGTTGGRYDQVETVTLPESGPPEHTHNTQDELFYFLAGAYRVKVGDRVFTASAGDFVRVPAGTPHAWRCIGKDAGKILLTYVPGGLRGFFEEIRPLYLAPEMDMAAAAAIGAKYGLALTGPPLTE